MNPFNCRTMVQPFDGISPEEALFISAKFNTSRKMADIGKFHDARGIGKYRGNVSYYFINNFGWQLPPSKQMGLLSPVRVAERKLED